MATLRCPQCGTVNRDDAVDFPLCRNCHERLIQCGYCRQFQRGEAEGRGTCRSKAAGGPRPAGVDDAPNCRYFQPRYAARSPAGSRVPIHLAAWILGVIAAIFVVLFTLSTLVRPSSPWEAAGATVQLAAEAPYRVEAGSEFTVTLTARNVSDRPTGHLRLGMPEPFLERFGLAGLDPAPTRRQASQGYAWFVYPSLRGGEWLGVTLRMRAPGPGAYELQARLAGSEGGMLHEVRVPVRVVGDQPARGVERDGSR